MKTTRTLVLSLLVLALSACSTIDSRIKEKSTVFTQLDAGAQAKIKQGTVDLGFNEDMVYMALGAPDQVRNRKTGEGQTTVWIYNTYFDRYEGMAHVGYHRWMYFDPAVRLYRVYWEPVYTDVYRRHMEEKIRVAFRGGKVVAIDQVKEP
ncbi:MAG: hypothetical protein PHQ04_06240 [Opitutaceae bacterium]|nr:hypothetical protein [Opitutaceae bacterium]